MEEIDILKEVKRTSFLKFKPGNNKLKILSQIGFLKSHYIGGTNVICKGEECFFCSKSNLPRKEIYYWAELDGERGFLRVPLSIFIAIMDVIKSGIYGIEKPRDASWLVIRKGEGRETRYTVNFIEKVKLDEKEVEGNTEKVEKFINKLRNKYNENYENKVAELNPDLEVKNEEKINPEDIPF